MANVPSPSTKSRDFHGEQQMGFYWGEQGYFFVDGPSGDKGHRANASGADGLAFRRAPEDLLILDNKSYASQSNVSGATAIDPTVNLGQYLDRMIVKVQNMKQLPHQSRILGLLEHSRRCLKTGRGWPPSVRLVVMNAGGQSTGVTKRLSDLGIRFIDYYQTPAPSAFASTIRPAKSVSKDYTDAQDYVTDCYSTWAQMHTDLGAAIHRAIDKFRDYSTIPEDRLGANVTYQLVRIVLGILPGAEPVIKLVDRLTKGLKLALEPKEIERIAAIAGVVAQRTAAGVYAAGTAPGGATQHETAAKALDNLSKLATEGAEEIENQRREMRANVEAIGNKPSFKGKVLELVRRYLGPKPEYRAKVIQQFEKEYELKLYMEYYIPRAHVDVHIDKFYMNREAFPPREVVFGIPDRVIARCLELTGGKESDLARAWKLERHEIRRTIGPKG
ncbi:MAG TPA: hypothetical protein VIH87_11845 [Methylocella sp.]